MKKRWIILYAILFFAICISPKLGLRNLLITADSRIRNAVLVTSPVENVIAGPDGWLFYKDSLDDYTGAAPMTDRALFDHAHTMAMFQNYCALAGAEFLYVGVPNKNTVEAEHMPPYYQKSESPSNWDRLHEYLEQEGVSYLDLKELLTGMTPRAGGLDVYLKRDSHWTNEGAAAGADAILDRLDIPHTDMTDADLTVRRDFTGDLAKMAYPADPGTEEQVYFEDMPEFTLISPEKTDDFFDPAILTQGSGDLNAVVYRDSFANALVPFMADAFSETLFTRGRPYDAGKVFTQEAGVVIVERAERFLPDDAGDPPKMMAFPAAETPESLRPVDCDVQIALPDEDTGEVFVRLSGSLPEDQLETESRVFVDPGDGLLYEAMPVHTDQDEGFVMYLQDDGSLNADPASLVQVYVGEDAEEEPKG